MVSPIGRLLAACFGRRALLLDLPNQPFGTQNLPRKPIRHTLRLPNGSEVVLRGLIKKAQVRRARCRLLRELHGLGATKGQQSAQLSGAVLGGPGGHALLAVALGPAGPARGAGRPGAPRPLPGHRQPPGRLSIAQRASKAYWRRRRW